MLDNLKAYTDGSFNKDTGIIGASSIMYINEEHPRILLDQIRNDDWFKFNQIPGECRAVVNAVKYAIRMGYKKITIYHDYNGLEYWTTGYYQAHNVVSQKYLAIMKTLESMIDIEFVCVKGHSDNRGNQLADYMARMAVHSEVELPENFDVRLEQIKFIEF